LSWLHHPKFIGARDNALAQLRVKEYHFRKLKPVIFLCGGAKSVPRDQIAEYLKKCHPGKLVFYADDVWSLISKSSDQNALEMETELAHLADMVLILVESPGTFAELGAFSLNDELRKKLLPILDLRHKGSESFINTGPVRWINQDSVFTPALWVDPANILTVVNELEDRLNRLPKPTACRIPDLSTNQKHLLFFLCDLVAIFGPCPLQHIHYYVLELLTKLPVPSCENLLALASAMDLVRIIPDPRGTNMYLRKLAGDDLFSFRRKGYIDFSSLRAQIVSVMIRIRHAKEAMETVGG
jgi:hypothetical protein